MTKSPFYDGIYTYPIRIIDEKSIDIIIKKDVDSILKTLTGKVQKISSFKLKDLDIEKYVIKGGYIKSYGKVCIAKIDFRGTYVSDFLRSIGEIDYRYIIIEELLHYYEIIESWYDDKDHKYPKFDQDGIYTQGTSYLLEKIGIPKEYSDLEDYIILKFLMEKFEVKKFKGKLEDDESKEMYLLRDDKKEYLYDSEFDIVIETDILR